LATTSEVLTFLGCPPTSTNLAARRLRTVSSDTYPVRLLLSRRLCQ
jgi:hypothetical protein